MNDKKFFLTVDVETAGTFENPLVYDIGYIIHDEQCNIFEQKSFVVEEIFHQQKELMEQSFYAAKIPTYWKAIKAREIFTRKLYYIRQEIKHLIKKYNVTTIMAYNAYFDINALNNTVATLSHNRIISFFNPKIEVNCIWHMSCQTIGSSANFIQTAVNNRWVTEKGNIRTSAEMMYRFITGKADFTEAHTGLEDVKIEIQIFEECIRYGLNINKMINQDCWKIVKNKRHALGIY